MFTLRHALGGGLLFLAITPALAQSVDDSQSQLRPFHDASIAAFDDVWQERDPDHGIERQISEVATQPIELASVQETATPEEGEAAVPTPVADSPRLWPTPTAPPLAKLPPLLSPTDTFGAAETGLFQWFLGMLGVVGLVALGGVYWIFHVRPALDVRHTTNRLRLSSALSLPRRSGLFLVDVEDQTVLVAMDGGGIRHVVPLGLGARMKTTGRRAAADKAPRASSPSTSAGATASEAVAFHDVYQELRAGGGDEGGIGQLAVSRPLCPLSPTIGTAFGSGSAVGERAGVRGPEREAWPPHPHPLPRNMSPCEVDVARGGEGAEYRPLASAPGGVRAVLPAAKSATRPQAVAAHSHKAS